MLRCNRSCDANATTKDDEVVRKALFRDIIERCRVALPAHPQLRNFAHFTFLVRDNEIISNGVNRAAEPSRKYGYHSRCDTPKWHSELDAVRRCRTFLHGCIAVNVRMNKQGSLRMSCPCSTCRHLLGVVGCKKVFFTHERGWGELSLR